MRNSLNNMARKTLNAYAYPVTVNENTRISYDESPAHVGNLEHAVDFVVPEGAPVKAAAEGIVVDLKNNSDIGGADKKLEPFGNFIELKHAHGEYSEYEHLKKDSVPVKIGDRVRKGQVIGLSGATGWLAHLGPHLHFMVGKYGKTNLEYKTLKILWEKETTPR